MSSGILYTYLCNHFNLKKFSYKLDPTLMFKAIRFSILQHSNFFNLLVWSFIPFYLIVVFLVVSSVFYVFGYNQGWQARHFLWSRQASLLPIVFGPTLSALHSNFRRLSNTMPLESIKWQNIFPMWMMRVNARW